MRRVTPIIDGFKLCNKCGETKPLKDYRVYKDGTLRTPCRACKAVAALKWRKANMEKANAQSKAYARRHPERMKDYDRKRSYGLAYGEFGKILTSQDNKCAICYTEKPLGRNGFNVDHCHATNKVRGILCSNCNIGIGNLQHDPDILRAALEYLLKDRQ